MTVWEALETVVQACTEDSRCNTGGSGNPKRYSFQRTHARGRCGNELKNPREVSKRPYEVSVQSVSKRLKPSYESAVWKFDTPRTVLGVPRGAFADTNMHGRCDGAHGRF